MNPVALTIINPKKEISHAGDQTCSQALQTTNTYKANLNPLLHMPIWTNGNTITQLSRKHFGKRRSCSLRAMSLFPTMFLKAVCC